jgi:hypothetical protein
MMQLRSLEELRGLHLWVLGFGDEDARAGATAG